MAMVFYIQKLKIPSFKNKKLFRSIKEIFTIILDKASVHITMELMNIIKGNGKKI